MNSRCNIYCFFELHPFTFKKKKENTLKLLINEMVLIYYYSDMHASSMGRKNLHFQSHYFSFQFCKKRLTRESRRQSQSQYELLNYAEAPLR